MTQLTLDVPQALVDLPKLEQELLVRGGLREAATARIRQLQLDIRQATSAVSVFEERYGVDIAGFETKVLTILDTLEALEDYNDWFYWTSVITEKQRLLVEIERISGL